MDFNDRRALNVLSRHYDKITGWKDVKDFATPSFGEFYCLSLQLKGEIVASTVIPMYWSVV